MFLVKTMKKKAVSIILLLPFTFGWNAYRSWFLSYFKFLHPSCLSSTYDTESHPTNNKSTSRIEVQGRTTRVLRNLANFFPLSQRIGYDIPYHASEVCLW